MARIRTFKPDFWTSPQVVAMSIPARLFFLGLWNFADDHGGVERSAIALKLKIFPADRVDVEPLIQEALNSRDENGQALLLEYQSDGRTYLHITGFAKHQKIDRPSKPRVPAWDGHNGIERSPAAPEAPKPEKKGRVSWAKAIAWNEAQGCFEGITPEIMAKWRQAYPAVDLVAQLNRADEWLKANPNKRKKNYYRFLVNWMGRSQERGGK